MDDYEVDLRDYLRVLWKGKWIVVITLLVAVGTALGLSYSTPKQYQTETSLLILPPLAQEVNGGVGGTVFSPETYEHLALADDLLQGVVKKVYPAGGGPTASSLRAQMKVEIEPATAKNPSGRLPLYLRVTFKGSDPTKLKTLAETWANEFIAKDTDLFLSRTAQSYDYIKQNFDAVAQELAAKEKERTSYQQENPLTVLQTEVTALQNVYKSYSSRLPEKQQELKEQEARLSALKEALAREPKYFTVQRGLSKEALWEFLSAGGWGSAKTLSALPDLTIQDHVLNDTYVSLRGQVAAAQASVQAAKAEVGYLESGIKDVLNLLEQKQARLVEVQVKLEQFDREVQVLTNTYNSLAAKLQEAKIARAETVGPIKTVEAPIIPTHPIAPNKRMNVAVAGVLGLFIGILLAFFVHFLQSGDVPQGRQKRDSQSLEAGQSDNKRV